MPPPVLIACQSVNGVNKTFYVKRVVNFPRKGSSKVVDIINLHVYPPHVRRNTGTIDVRAILYKYPDKVTSADFYRIYIF